MQWRWTPWRSTRWRAAQIDAVTNVNTAWITQSCWNTEFDLSIRLEATLLSASTLIREPTPLTVTFRTYWDLQYNPAKIFRQVITWTNESCQMLYKHIYIYIYAIDWTTMIGWRKMQWRWTRRRSAQSVLGHSIENNTVYWRTTKTDWGNHTI